MKYDFTTIYDRKGHDALAVDGLGSPDGFTPGMPKEGFSVLPMWVADMSFATAPAVTKAISARLEHPLFGYYYTSDEYCDSVISWHKRRNGSDISKEDILYENGVLGCLSSAIRAFTGEGDPILIHSPTYIGFKHTLEKYDRKVICSELKKDADGIWRMDFEEMEKLITDNGIRFAIFCSPFNPVGRVWTRPELERMMKLFEKYDVTVFSDEIWSDLILDGNIFIPTHSISGDARMRTVTAYAPSKTFNLAGLIGSYSVVFSKDLRDRLRAQGDMTHYNSMNVLSQHALIGAYSKEGEEWVDELCTVLSRNSDYAYRHITANYKGVSVSKAEGTYMLFLDLKEYAVSNGLTLDGILRAGWDVGVIWQDGRPFGGEYTIRLNVALPFSMVKEAFDRLDRYVFTKK